MSFINILHTFAYVTLIMETMVVIGDAQLSIEAFTDLVAEAIIKKTKPVDDMLSTTQAEKEYGRSFLNQAREAGIMPKRFGNKNVYSRHALDSYFATGVAVEKREQTNKRGRKCKYTF